MTLTREFRKGRSSLPLLAVNDPWPLWTDAAPIITRAFTVNVSGQNYSANAPQHTWNGGKIAYIGATMVQAGASGSDAAAGSNRSFAFDPSNTVRVGGQYRARFGINSPEFAFHYAGQAGADFALMIDGKLMWPPIIQGGLNGGGGSYNSIKVALDTLTTDQEVQSVAVNAGGTGYVDGDIVTLSGGTNSKPATFVVTRQTGGVVNSVTPVERGRYSITPSSPAATTTGGAGAGLTLTPTWRTKRLNKNRTVEILFSGGAKLVGVSVGPSYDVWPLPARGPKMLVVGDSLSEASIIDWAHGIWWINMARRLGFDDYAGFALGSTGWVSNFAGARSSFVNRLADVIAWAPDFLVIPGSSNDGTGTGVEAAATQFWENVQASLPNCQCIAMAPWTGTTGAIVPQANADANKAAALAAGVPYIDSYGDGSNGWLRNGLNNSWILAKGDVIHPQQVGHDYYGLRAANEARQLLAA